MSQRGVPAEVARRPATDYTARLVGLNLYRGTRADPHAVALDGGGRLTVASTGTAGDQALVAVRPSAITLHSRPPEAISSRNTWPGTVDGVELLTDRVRVQVSGQPSALVDLTADAVAELHLDRGTPVWLSVKATELDTYPPMPED